MMPDDAAIAAPASGRRIEIRGDAEDAGQRLDRVLQRHLPEMSRNRFKQLILAGAVTWEGAVQRDPARRGQARQHFSIVIPQPADPGPAAPPMPPPIPLRDEPPPLIHKPGGLGRPSAPG